MGYGALFSLFIQAFLVSSMVGLDYTAEQREVLNPLSKKGLLSEQGLASLFALSRHRLCAICPLH